MLFRSAGTTQVYKPLEAIGIFELPLHAMDTSMFYPNYLHLSASQASVRLQEIADHAARFGGCMTINWHDRSVAPERQWDGCYRDLIQDLESRGAWFATADQAVRWFGKRRTAVLGINAVTLPTVLNESFADNDDGHLPGVSLRTYSPEVLSDKITGGYVRMATADILLTYRENHLSAEGRSHVDW